MLNKERRLYMKRYTEELRRLCKVIGLHHSVYYYHKK